jgi:ATP-dependent Clp protease, protease subunit
MYKYEAERKYRNSEEEVFSGGPVIPEVFAPADDKSNDVYLFGEITTESLLRVRKELNVKIKNYRKFLIENGLDLSMSEHFHVNLYINSNGGYVLDSFGLHDFIKRSPIPIYTYVDGVCASAATIISVAGHQRFMSRSSFFMIHQLRSWFGGKYDEFADEKMNLDAIMDRIRNIYLNATKLEKPKLDSMLKRDLFLEIDKCIEYGFIDAAF